MRRLRMGDGLCFRLSPQDPQGALLQPIFDR
jgi:hypothetical protein